MGITSALVLYAVIWWMCFLIALPIKVQTQGDLGKVEPGTHASAPANLNMRKKAKLVTMIAAAIWVILAAIIFSGVITVRDIDWFDRMGAAGEAG